MLLYAIYQSNTTKVLVVLQSDCGNVFAGYLGGQSSSERAAGICFAVVLPTLFLVLSLYLVVRHLMLLKPDLRPAMYLLEEQHITDSDDEQDNPDEKENKEVALEEKLHQKLEAIDDSARASGSELDTFGSGSASPAGAADATNSSGLSPNPSISSFQSKEMLDSSQVSSNEERREKRDSEADVDPNRRLRRRETLVSVTLCITYSDSLLMYFNGEFCRKDKE